MLKTPKLWAVQEFLSVLKRLWILVWYNRQVIDANKKEEKHTVEVYHIAIARCFSRTVKASFQIE